MLRKSRLSSCVKRANCARCCNSRRELNEGMHVHAQSTRKPVHGTKCATSSCVLQHEMPRYVRLCSCDSALRLTSGTCQGRNLPSNLDTSRLCSAVSCAIAAMTCAVIVMWRKLSCVNAVCAPRTLATALICGSASGMRNTRTSSVPARLSSQRRHRCSAVASACRPEWSGTQRARRSHESCVL